MIAIVLLLFCSKEIGFLLVGVQTLTWTGRMHSLCFEELLEVAKTLKWILEVHEKGHGWQISLKLYFWDEILSSSPGCKNRKEKWSQSNLFYIKLFIFIVIHSKLELLHNTICLAMSWPGVIINSSYFFSLKIVLIWIISYIFT